MNPLRKLLADPHKKAIILDGGFGTELERSAGKDYGNVRIQSQRQTSRLC